MRTDTFTGREKIAKIIVSVFGFVLRFLVLVFSGKKVHNGKLLNLNYTD